MTRIVRNDYGKEIGFICSTCNEFAQGFAYGYYKCSSCWEQSKRDNENIKLRKEIERLNNLLESK